MNKRILQAFAAGMITATSILALTFYLGGYHTANDNTQEIASVTEADIVKFLDQNEQVAISKSEYEQLTSIQNSNESGQTEQKNDDQNKEEPQEQKEELKEEEAQEVKTVSITIKEGMATSDVAKLFESAGVVDSASEFSKYLIEHEYHTRVQIGTFEVKTDMSFYQLAEAITR
ncbi:endolytic transglycosylase MltG [Bacillus kexueae]|uniref:endolytic transglycosylase MltG n=1 Tax=Aeribacillus kexueae TaxID=2078952 RepID=UPI001FAE91CF|nr:endolytic transglycosylase MltG [Bacillus kexueae]